MALDDTSTCDCAAKHTITAIYIVNESDMIVDGHKGAFRIKRKYGEFKRLVRKYNVQKTAKL